MAEDQSTMPDTQDLKDIPGLVRAELTRLRAERTVLAEERLRLTTALREAELSNRDLAAHRDSLLEQATHVADLTARANEGRALAGEVERLRTERDILRSELTACRRERDRLRLHLLDAELKLASTLRGSAQDPLDQHQSAVTAAQQELAAAQQRAALAEQRAAHLAGELDATMRTISWRVTAPLRAVRRRTRS